MVTKKCFFMLKQMVSLTKISYFIFFKYIFNSLYALLKFKFKYI